MYKQSVAMLEIAILLTKYVIFGKGCCWKYRMDTADFMFRLLDVAQEGTPLQDAFLLADDVLRQVS